MDNVDWNNIAKMAVLMGSSMSADPTAANRAAQGLMAGEQMKRKDQGETDTKGALAEIYSGNMDMKSLASKFPYADSKMIMGALQERQQGKQNEVNQALSFLQPGSQVPAGLMSNLSAPMQAVFSDGKVPGMSELDKYRAKKGIDQQFRTSGGGGGQPKFNFNAYVQMLKNNPEAAANLLKARTDWETAGKTPTATKPPSASEQINQYKLEGLKAILSGTATPEQQKLFGKQERSYISQSLQMLNNDWKFKMLPIDEKVKKVLENANILESSDKKRQGLNPSGTGSQAQNPTFKFNPSTGKIE